MIEWWFLKILNIEPYNPAIPLLNVDLKTHTQKLTKHQFKNMSASLSSLQHYF